jgi:hypothetical protein
MTFDEYYSNYKDIIIANPNGPAPEVTKDGKTRILLAGAEITMGYQVPIVRSRASAFQSTYHTGQVLGQVWQGFRTPSGKDYLFTSNPTAAAIHRDATSEPGEISKFGSWLKEGGKNKVGSIYNSLEGLGFLKRLWGADDQYVTVDEGGGKISRIKPIRYINDSTVEQVNSKTFEAQMSFKEKFRFEQRYNGKTLAEAVLERYNNEVVAKGNQVSSANASLISSNSSVSSHSKIEPQRKVAVIRQLIARQCCPQGALVKMLRQATLRALKAVMSSQLVRKQKSFRA